MRFERSIQSPSKLGEGAREMAQRLRALTDSSQSSGGPGFDSSIHMAAHTVCNSSSSVPNTFINESKVSIYLKTTTKKKRKRKNPPRLKGRLVNSQVRPGETEDHCQRSRGLRELLLSYTSLGLDADKT